MHYLLVNIICALTLSNASPDVERAQQTLDSLYQNYAAPNTCLHDQPTGTRFDRNVD